MNDRIYIQFADNGNIRKWQREPFDGGVAYLAAATAAVPADIAALVERLREEIEFDNGASDGPGEVTYGALFEQAASALTAAYASLAAVEKDRTNLQAALTARAKTMLRLRNALIQVHDHIEDEGDRVYFGSTNDAEALKDVWHELDGWNWDDIMSDGKLSDVYEASRKAHACAEAAEASLAEARKALAEKDAALAPFAREADELADGVPDSAVYDVLP